jgi:hypothetical protein
VFDSLQRQVGEQYQSFKPIRIYPSEQLLNFGKPKEWEYTEGLDLEDTLASTLRLRD